MDVAQPSTPVASFLKSRRYYLNLHESSLKYHFKVEK